jgi:hypothetical protein
MKWPRWLRWRRLQLPPVPNGTAGRKVTEQEAKLHKAQRDQPVVDHVARQFQRQPPDDFVRRVQALFDEGRRI